MRFGEMYRWFETIKSPKLTFCKFLGLKMNKTKVVETKCLSDGKYTVGIGRSEIRR